MELPTGVLGPSSHHLRPYLVGKHLKLRPRQRLLLAAHDSAAQ
jgi:hypothetical protein